MGTERGIKATRDQGIKEVPGIKSTRCLDASCLDAFPLHPEPPSGSEQINDLLRRMHNGDRDAAAEFMKRYGARIRRRVRGKLGNSMRRLFDSQEILSTIGRRLDLYVRNGNFDAAKPEQLWTLVFRIADRALADKALVFRRLEQVEQPDAPFAHDLLSRLKEAEQRHEKGMEIAIDSALRSLVDPVDRQILSHWLLGLRLCDIAELLGHSASMVRKRWERIKDHLRGQVAAELL